MQRVTQHSLKTTDPIEFRAAIEARRDSYHELYEFFKNKNFKRLKLAMRARIQRTIDELVEKISYGGEAPVIVIGDCSKTTGFRSCTPGGPIKKIKRYMVKKGLQVLEENEAYTTKSSVCCHGHENQCMKNGHSLAEYKNGIYMDCPRKMPQHVHGILICQGCGRTWNRDFVGAINILNLYMARVHGEPRPERFTWAYWHNRNLL